MIVLHAHGQFEELELAATALEWQAFAMAIMHDGIEIPCESSANPHPYQRSLERIVIRHRPHEKIRLALVDERVLQISGDPATLGKLAESANFESDCKPDYHFHVENLGADHHVAADSIPAVFVLNPPSPTP